MASIGQFCIDRYEAHLVTRGPSGELTPHPYYQRPEEGVAYEARSDAGVFPQGYVNRIESSDPEGTAITEYQLLRLRDAKDGREFRTVTGGVMHVSGGIAEGGHESTR